MRQQHTERLTREQLLDAIKKYCLECCGGAKREVIYCKNSTCALHEVRAVQWGKQE